MLTILILMSAVETREKHQAIQSFHPGTLVQPSSYSKGCQIVVVSSNSLRALHFPIAAGMEFSTVILGTVGLVFGTQSTGGLLPVLYSPRVGNREPAG